MSLNPHDLGAGAGLAPARCAACGVELAPGMLACPACRKLVHAARLKEIVAAAEVAEREGRVTDALRGLREAQDLLPRGSTQHTTLGDRIRRLSETVDRAVPAAPAGRWSGKGVLGAVAVAAWKLKAVVIGLLLKGKLLVTGLASLPTLLSMFAWLAIDRRRAPSFGVGLVLSIYLHEMGHVAALQRYGIKATAPMFVPGLGALVRLHQYPADAREDARVGLAGPVWGAVAAVLALAAGRLLAGPTLIAVASLGATINLFNLVPFWQLDGARGFRALDARQRGIVLAIAALAALALDQAMPWVICAVGGLRFKRDLPSQGDARAFRTFAALAVVLPLIAWAGQIKP